MKDLQFILISAALFLSSAITSFSAAPPVLSHWVVAPISHVDLDENWIVASRAENLIKIPVTDSSNSEQIQMESPVEDVLIADGLVYVLTASEKLFIFDVEASLRETPLGQIELGHAYQKMVLDRDRRLLDLIGDGDCGILDVSDPGQPLILQHHEISSLAQDIKLSGDLVLIADSNYVVIYQLDDNGEFSEIGSYRHYGSDIFEMEPYRDAVVSSAVRNSFGGGGLRIVSIADPTDPQLVATLPVEGFSLEIENDLAILADFDSLTTLDLSDIENPQIIGDLRFSGSSSEIAATGTHCILGHSGTLSYLNLSFPIRPYPQWSIAYPAQIYSIAAGGSALYLATDLGVDILDLSSPEQIVKETSLDFDYSISRILLDGDLMLLKRASYYEYLPIDISAPATPAEYPAWIYWSDLVDAQLVNGILYGAAGDEGLNTYDFSDPESPVQIGTLRLSESAHQIRVEGDLAVVLSRLTNSVLSIVDISHPSSPELLGEFRPGEYLSTISSGGGLVFFSSGWQFSVLDPAEGTNAHVVGVGGTPGETISHLSWIEGQLHCTTYNGKTMIYGLEIPAAPRLVAVLDGRYSSLHTVTVAGAEFEAATASDGVWIREKKAFTVDPREPDGRSGR